MIMHASEIPEGNYWQKVIAQQALQALGPRDYCGVLHWSGTEQWLWQPGMREVGESRGSMLARIDRMTPGDMPQFEPAMVLVHRAMLGLADAAVKHVVIISDGDPTPPSAGIVQTLKGQSVTISTVAVGAHGPPESQTLANMAVGGKFYQVSNPRALPKIFQREARRVTRPLIYEKSAGVRPQVRFPHEMLHGLSEPLPPISGFVLTSRKESPLVETALVSPEPADEETSTLLASWTYGAGRAVAFTSDATRRWCAAWTEPGLADVYDKLFGQIVDWSMRPVAESGKFNVATDASDGQVRVVISALDKDDRFLNFLNMSGTAVGPSLKPVPLRIEQTVPGHYVGTLPARDAGSYFLVISPGPGQAVLRAGVTVPFSDEFRDLATNQDLLEQLAGLTPQGGRQGKLLPALGNAAGVDEPLRVNPFRHDLKRAYRSTSLWPALLVLACWLFWGDVFVRRVHVGFGWMPRLAGRLRDRLLRRPVEAGPPEFIERLRSRKSEISERLAQRREAARFEPPPEPPAAPPPVSPGAPPAEVSPKPEEPGYTERLLEAKKRVWEERKKKP